MDINQIWQELDLGGLLQGQAQLFKNPAIVKADPFLKHDKRWKKPTYSVLKDRYGSAPNEPKLINKSKISKLADPLYGKYVGNTINRLEDVIALASEDDENDIYNFNYGSPSKHSNNGMSPNKQGGGGGFFLTEADVNDEEPDTVTDQQINSFIRRRIRDASKFATKDKQPETMSGKAASLKKKKQSVGRSKDAPSGVEVSNNKKAKQNSLNSSLNKGGYKSNPSDTSGTGVGGRVSSVTKKRKKAKDGATAAATSSTTGGANGLTRGRANLNDSLTKKGMMGNKKLGPLGVIKEERAAVVAKKRSESLGRIKDRSNLGGLSSNPRNAKSKLEMAPVNYGAPDLNERKPVGGSSSHASNHVKVEASALYNNINVNVNNSNSNNIGSYNGNGNNESGKGGEMLRSNSARELDRRKRLAPIQSKGTNTNMNNNSSNSNNNDEDGVEDAGVDKMSEIRNLAANRGRVNPNNHVMHGPGAGGGRSALHQAAAAGRGRANVRSAPSLLAPSISLAGLDKVSETERRDWHSRANVQVSKRDKGRSPGPEPGISPSKTDRSPSEKGSYSNSNSNSPRSIGGHKDQSHQTQGFAANSSSSPTKQGGGGGGASSPPVVRQLFKLGPDGVQISSTFVVSEDDDDTEPHNVHLVNPERKRPVVGNNGSYNNVNSSSKESPGYALGNTALDMDMETAVEEPNGAMQMLNQYRSTDELLSSLKSVQTKDTTSGNRGEFKEDMKIANQLASRIKNIGKNLNAAESSNESYKRLVEGLE